MNMIYSHHSLNYMLDSLARIGIKRFELWAPCCHFDLNVPTLRDVSRLRSMVYGRGFEITCVTPEQCAYPYNIASDDAYIRRRAVAHFESYLDVAAELGVGKMLCGSGWGNVDEDLQEAWRRAADSLSELAAYAEQAGVDLAFEILNPYETNLVHSLADMKRMSDEIKSPRFKLCIDTVPVELDGKKLSDFFDAFGPQIIHIHMTDGDPIGHVPPGRGRYDMAAYFKTLRSNDYQGDVTIEICDMAWSNEPEHATRIGYENLCAALEKSKIE